MITDINDGLSRKYGDMVPLSINCGKVHEYLGMVFDFSKSGEVKITIYQYIDSVIEDAPDIYKVFSRGE